MGKRAPKEYEDLFCVGDLTELERQLYGGEPYRERVGGMHYCTKTERAGDTMVLSVYPILGKSDRARAEAARRAMSRERQARYNREKSRRKLALLLDANFGESDLHLTLTYRGTPPSYEQAKRHVQNFLRAVKRMREKAGLSELKYVYVIEEEGGDGEKRRIHIHLVMNGGLDRGALEGKWGRGYANCDRLQPEDGDGLRQLARYLTKCEMEKHRRAWCASKKLEGKWGRGYANCDRLQPEDGDGLRQLARYLTKCEMEKHRRAWCASKNLRKPRTTVSRTRLSTAKVRRLCEEIPGNAREIMGKLYPDYALGRVEPYLSDWAPGVYLRIQLRRRRP